MVEQVRQWLKNHKLHINSVKTMLVCSVVVLIGCILLAASVADAVAREKMKNSILEANRETAQFLCSYLDLEVRHLNNILYNYLSDSNLNAITVERSWDVEYIKEIQQVSRTVSRTASENKLIDDVVILFHDVPYVVSKEGHFSKDYYYQYNKFVESILSIDKKELERVKVIPRFRKTVLSGDSIVEKEVILFCIATNQFTVALMVDKDTFGMMLQAGMQEQDNRLVIVSGTDLIYNQSGIENSALLKNGDFTQRREKLTIEGADYFLTGVHSENFNWDYVILHPLSAINREISAISTPYKYLYAALILMCIALLFWYQKKLLLPIRKLTSATYDNTSEFQQKEFILLNNLRYQNEQLNDFVSYNIQTGRRRILENLIFNRLPLQSKEEKNYFGEMGYAAFLLIKIVTIDCADFDRLRKEIEEQLQGLPCLYLSLGLMEDSFYLMINCDQEREVVEVIRRCLENENIMGGDLFAAAATAVQELNRLIGSAQQIQTIVTGRNMNTDDCVYMIDDVIRRDLYTKRFASVEEELKNALEQDGVKAFLKEHTLRGKNISYRELRALLLRMYRAAAQVAEENKIDKQRYLPAMFLLADAPEEYPLNLWKEEVQLSSAFQRLADALRQGKEPSGDRLAEEIIAYIRENYNRYISLDLVAQKFHMNANYLSVYIKRHLGMTFTEYMETLRMDKARELMDETDMSVSGIAAALGFDSPSSFIRFFRKKEGITPGEYRKGMEAKRE